MAKAKLPIGLVGRLTAAMKASRWSLEYYRDRRREFVRQLVGRNWSEEGSGKAVPVNVIERFVTITGRTLLNQNPQALLTTFQRKAKPQVDAMKAWVNQEIQEMDLGEQLSRCVNDSFFGMGIGKVALSTPSDAHTQGWALRAGDPYFESIDLDDFCFDHHARRFSQVSFMGHRYRVTLESVRDDSKLYAKDRKDLQASTDPFYNQEGDERISMLGRGYRGNQEEVEDMVDLWEVYLPRMKLILTLAAEDGAGGLPTDKEPLRVQRWLGPPEGPYHLLGLGTVPGNAMPLAPIQNLFDLHIFLNQSFRKLMDQSNRQKSVLPVRGASDGDMNRLAEADDGFAFRCDGEPPQEVQYGGPSQINLAMFMQTRQLFDQMAGNLSLQAGTGPQAKTARQEEMLNQNNSATLADMSSRVVKFTTGVVRALCWYWWHDPFNTHRVEESVPGFPERTMLRQVTPEQRRALKWEDLRIKIDPYSLQQQTPLQKANEMDELVAKIVLPLMPVLQQQGITFDVGAYLQKRAELRQMPELPEFISVGEPVQQEGGPRGAALPQTPQETTRNYVRENVSEKTQQGQADNTIAQLLTGNDQGGNGEGNGKMMAGLMG